VVLGGAGYCLIGLLGLGLGATIRHTPGAIAVLVGGVYVLAQMVAAFAPPIMPYLPVSIVANSMSTVRPVPGVGQVHFLSPWAGLGMLSLYAAVTLVLGAWRLASRDA
jgi:ABC-2 type transport system permease protein